MFHLPTAYHTGMGLTPSGVTVLRADRSDDDLARQSGARYQCAVCGHASTHDDPATLRDLARAHAAECWR